MIIYNKISFIFFKNSVKVYFNLLSKINGQVYKLLEAAVKDKDFFFFQQVQ